MMKKAFVFPGQGAQKVGMVKDLYDAYPVVKQLFEEADRRLGFLPDQALPLKVPMKNS